MKKVNLGCGRFRLNGFINVDIKESVNNEGLLISPDVLMDAIDFMHQQDEFSIDVIYCGHFLEHLKPDVFHTLMLLIDRKLKLTGVMVATLPDTEKALNAFNDGQLDLKSMTDCVMGDRSDEYEYHHQVFTEDAIMKIFSQYFKSINFVTYCPWWPASVIWQTCFMASRSEDFTPPY